MSWDTQARHVSENIPAGLQCVVVPWAPSNLSIGNFRLFVGFFSFLSTSTINCFVLILLVNPFNKQYKFTIRKKKPTTYQFSLAIMSFINLCILGKNI